ncbi:MAG: DUF4982 domain-containing protein [Bacteroidaceae bacterium]|nr:DUF4982 domain-containing protein [Bacteroidaceae bacterium]
MRRLILFSLMLLSFAAAHAQRKQSLDMGWKFMRGGVVNAEAKDFDDSKWRTLTVPHDFSMEAVFDTLDYRQRNTTWNDVQVGPFSRMSIGDWDTGQTVGGVGWYRKTFQLPIVGNASVETFLSQTNVNVRFDGVYNQAEVWVNGIKAAVNVYGYMPFVVNLNKILMDEANRRKNEREVTLVVKAVNEGLNSRWYAGSGMFRHVWLEQTDKLHLDEWDTFVDGSELINKGKDANVKVFAKVFNGDTQYAVGQLCVDIMDDQQNTVAHSEVDIEVPVSEDGALFATEMTVKAPKLWSLDNPYRYTAKVYVTKYGEEKDALYVPFGIRSISFNAEEGFKLNGKSLKLYGGCVHHDNGLLGAAGIDRAEVRKVELMKAQGYNAVRCSHNLPTEAFLNACDSLGMLVIDEVFDQWEEAKRRHDYSQYFTRDHEKDMALMVRRDRNHPSVIMWSIGNEIAQRADIPRGKEIALELNLVANNNDGTRPTTLAVNSFWDRPKFKWETDSYRAFENVEVGGYNYEWGHYEADHDSFPDRIIYGSESFPKEMAQNWNLVEKHPYVIGDFVWTAIDYIGEAGLGHTLERSDNRWIQFLSWPWFNAWCGDLDLIGDKKPQSYYRDVLWRRSKIAMAVRPSVTHGEREDVNGWGWTAEENHWNWKAQAYSKGEYLPVDIRPENYQTTNVVGNIRHNINGHRDDSLRVNVYSREPRVQLLINDSIMGEKDTDPETYTATFTVAYEPGSLKAQTVPAAKKAKPETVEFITALRPARITLKADRDTISASHNDLSYINICVEDEEGHFCPTAEVPLEITFSGKAKVVAGTGHPYDMESFRSLRPTTFRGKALAIVQPQDAAGTVTLTVKAKGLETAQITIEMQ